METKKIIGHDADDNLFETLVALNDFHNATFGTNFQPKDYVTYSLAEIWGVHPFEAKDREMAFFESDFYHKIEIKEKAYESIDYLSGEYEQQIITGRSSKVEDKLHGTVARFFKPEHFTEIHHLGSLSGYGYSRHKWQLAKEKKISLLVDDYQHHILLAAHQGIYGILMQAPWNKNVGYLPDNVWRARNMEEAVEIIEREKSIIFRY